jgi:hypothetical protein
MRLVPVSQVTYGTDYPYYPLDQNKNLDKLGLSSADVKAIESGNAARLIPRPLDPRGDPAPPRPPLEFLRVPFRRVRDMSW